MVGHGLTRFEPYPWFLYGVFDGALSIGIRFRVSGFGCSVVVGSTSRGRFEGCHGRFCLRADFVLAVMPCLPSLLDIRRQLALEHFLLGSGFDPNLNHGFVVLVPDYAFDVLLHASGSIFS
jgi:hypothetical protein